MPVYTESASTPLAAFCASGVRGWMSVDETQGKWEKEQEGALVRAMARGWNEIESNQGRGGGGGGGSKEEFPSIKCCFGLSFATTVKVFSGHGVSVCVCLCVIVCELVGGSPALSYIFHVPQSSQCCSTQEVSTNESTSILTVWLIAAYSCCRSSSLLLCNKSVWHVVSLQKKYKIIIIRHQPTSGIELLLTFLR